MQKKVLYYFVGIIVYRYILDLCYVQVIEPVFNYLGFVNRETFTKVLGDITINVTIVIYLVKKK